MAEESYDFFFKIILIGDSGVGKPQLLRRPREYQHASRSTIGVELGVRTMDIDGAKIKLQVWDTAGQERYRAITRAYYRGAMGVMIVYDVTVERTFENITNWMRSLQENASEDVEIMILGNNCHLEAERQVSRARGEELASELGIKFMEVSGEDGTNVEEAFLTLARAIKRKMETGCAAW